VVIACPWWAGCRLYLCGDAVLPDCPGSRVPGLVRGACDLVYGESSLEGAVAATVFSVDAGGAEYAVLGADEGSWVRWYPRTRGRIVEPLSVVDYPAGFLASDPLRKSLAVFVFYEPVPLNVFRKRVLGGAAPRAERPVVDAPSPHGRWLGVVQRYRRLPVISPSCTLNLVIDGRGVCGWFLEGRPGCGFLAERVLERL